MRLDKVLDRLNQLEKNAFLKIISDLAANKPKNAKQIEKILSDKSRDFKDMEHAFIAELFGLVDNEYKAYIESELLNTTSQLDLLSDILIRDGNSKSKLEWFSRLYEEEVKLLNKKSKDFAKELESESKDVSENRVRDYKLYLACLKTAYTNDDTHNQSRKISWDEQSILNTLARELSLSHEELKLINSQIIKLEPKNIQDVINELKSLGVVFYSKKHNTIYVCDEVVRILRKIRGKDLSDKHFRRVLRHLKPAQLNMICREHGIKHKGSDEEKVRAIIDSGVSLQTVLQKSIYKEGATLTEKKKYVTEFAQNILKITTPIRGSLLEEKIGSIIDYFEMIENDSNIGISIGGYEALLSDINSLIPKANDYLRNEFQLQELFVLNQEYLFDYNIKPRDVLELLSSAELHLFCSTIGVKIRGDIIQNILAHYKDSESLYIENYDNLGKRDLHTLKANGILIEDSNIGVKFEEVTKKIFSDLGLNVDEELRKKISTSKNQIDIIINLGGNDVLLVECKTFKDRDYNKFSSISRQLKSYSDEIEKNGFKVVKTLIIAPDFSDDFVKECDLHYALNISLIKSSSLSLIHAEFKKAKLKIFPHNLFMRDIVIDETRIIKALSK